MSLLVALTDAPDRPPAAASPPDGVQCLRGCLSLKHRSMVFDREGVNADPVVRWGAAVLERLHLVGHEQVLDALFSNLAAVLRPGVQLVAQCGARRRHSDHAASREAQAPLSAVWRA